MSIHKIVNLLTETIADLEHHGKTVADVRFVTDGKASCDWAEFAERAAAIDYDDGFGGNYIHLGLMVVGADWWLERGEYDGSEWWDFKTQPTRPPIGSVEISNRSYLGL